MIAIPLLFLSGDVPLSARVYRSTDDLLERQPAVLVTGSWLTVTEQMAHGSSAPAWPTPSAWTTPPCSAAPPRRCRSTNCSPPGGGPLPGFDATHHLTGPVLVSGDTIDTHVVAHHWLADDAWIVHGHYTARVFDATIAALTLRSFHQTGNLTLPATAAERAATTPRS